MKVKTIDIEAREWFDKTYGNSYFSAQITINFGMKTEKRFKLPWQYGYGEHFVYEATKLLTEKGFIKDMRYGFSTHCRDNGIILRTSKQQNCLKRDMVAWGKD